MMKSLFTSLLLAASLTASAEDFSLYYDLASGVKNTEVSAVSNLQKLVFDHNGNLIIYKKDGSSQTLDITSVSRIFFSTPEAVGIKEVVAEESARKGIYDLTGRKIEGKTQDSLPKGIYIIDGKKTQVK